MEIQNKINNYPIFYRITLKIVKVLYFFIRKYRGISSTIDYDKVFIISLHKLGDTIFTFSAVKYIIGIYGPKIYIVCYSESATLYKILNPDLNIIKLTKEDFMLDGRFCKRKARKKIKEFSPNLVFDLTGTISSVSLLLGVSKCIIYGSTSEPLLNFYDKSDLYRKKPHLIDMYFDTVRLKHPFAKPDFIPEKKFNFSPTDYILIQPFAGWDAKEWNLKKYLKLAEELSKKYNLRIIFEKGKINDDVLEFINESGIKTIQTKDFNELLEAIKNCSILIGNDSGPIYIADFFGKPTFSIYGPTNPIYSLPLGDFNRHIFYKIKCGPNGTQYCYTQGGLNCPSYECMNYLDFQTVLCSIELFLTQLQIERLNITFS